MKNWLIEITTEHSHGSERSNITVYARDEDHAREMGERAAEIMAGDWGSMTPEYWISGAIALE